MRAAGAEVEEVLGDISDEGVVARAVEVVRGRWGRADVLVNNAGDQLPCTGRDGGGGDVSAGAGGESAGPVFAGEGFGGMMP